eukprot:1160366-Pelagomonas_calceolata.AAC.6
MEQIAINKSHCAVLVGGLHWATMKALCKVTICCKRWTSVTRHAQVETRAHIAWQEEGMTSMRRNVHTLHMARGGHDKHEA